MTRRDFILKWLWYATALAPILILNLYLLPRFPIFGIILSAANRRHHGSCSGGPSGRRRLRSLCGNPVRCVHSRPARLHDAGPRHSGHGRGRRFPIRGTPEFGRLLSLLRRWYGHHPSDPADLFPAALGGAASDAAGCGFAGNFLVAGLSAPDLRNLPVGLPSGSAGIRFLITAAVFRLLS